VKLNDFSRDAPAILRKEHARRTCADNRAASIPRFSSWRITNGVDVETGELEVKHENPARR
jgi:hypothetical protein